MICVQLGAKVTRMLQPMTSVYGQWQYQKFSLLVLMEMIHREARYMYTLTTSDTHMTNITAPVAQQETSSDFLYLYQVVTR